MESTVNGMADPERVRPRALSRRRDFPARAFLLGLMAVGSLALWIGVPIACSWIVSRITDDAAIHLQITVPSTIAAMVLFAVGLVWLNRLYLRILARARPQPLDEEAIEGARYARGPLEPILVASLVLALIALTVWFFVFAENPPPHPF